MKIFITKNLKSGICFLFLFKKIFELLKNKCTIYFLIF